MYVYVYVYSTYICVYLCLCRCIYTYIYKVSKMVFPLTPEIKLSSMCLVRDTQISLFYLSLSSNFINVEGTFQGN